MVSKQQKVFTVEEVAAIVRMDEETIRRAIRAKRLRAAKPGRDFRVTEADLEAWWMASGGGPLFGKE